MNIDTRARRAAQAIHEAVEVREMTTQTKDHKPVERFDDYRDRKQRNRRLGAMLAAAAVVILAAILVYQAVGTPEQSVPADNGAAIAPASKVSPLDGKWRTAVITKQDVRSFLAEIRLSEAADVVAAEYPQIFTFSVNAGQYGTVSARVAGGTAEGVDSGVIEVDGNRLILIAEGGGQVVYTWTLDGDTLQLTYVSDTFPDVGGIADEAFGRAIYEASPMTPAPTP